LKIDNNIAGFLQQYFDRIFVVSVPRFTDRHSSVQQHLEGLHFDFFWGADKLALNAATLGQEGIYDEQRAISLHRHGKPLNLGEVACSLSHRMVYEEMIKNNWSRVLILEDDVLPLYDQLEQLPAALRELPPDWELVYLGYLKHEKVTAGLKIKQFFYRIRAALGLMKWNVTMVNNLLPRKISPHLKKAGFHDCTHAYAVTLEAAKKLAAAQKPVVYRADDLLSYHIMRGDIKGFVTDPKFFDQEAFHNSGAPSEIR
jgi:glycosyl transferase family 25